jgi:flagellar biosynthesis protein FlhA
VPALIVSIAAGLLVSKAGLSGAADKALLNQFSGYPKALGMSAAVMLVMALLPGIPMIPFLALGGGTAGLAYVVDRRHKRAAAADAKKADPEKAVPAEEPMSATLKMDDLKIELGYALLPLVNASGNGDRLTEQIKALRRSLASEMGFVMPSLRILDNVQLDANGYVIKVKEVESGSGKVWYGQFMVMDPTGKQVTLPGVHTTEPTFGLPATWIEASLKEEASVKGYTVVDSATVLATHLTELIKANMSELLSYGEVQNSSRNCRRNRASSSRTSCRHRSPFRAFNGCCRSCWQSACRSATSPPFWKASPTAFLPPAIRRCWPSTCAGGSRVSFALST